MRPLGLKFIGVIFLVLTVFTAVSLMSYSCADPPDEQVFPKPESIKNFCGPLGAYLSSFLLNLFGWSALLLLFPAGFCIYRCFAGKPLDQIILRTVGLCFTVAGLSGLFGIFGRYLFFSYGSAIGPGGYLGTAESLLLEHYVVSPGVEIFLISIVLGGLVLVCDIPLKFRDGKEVDRGETKEPEKQTAVSSVRLDVNRPLHQNPRGKILQLNLEPVKNLQETVKEPENYELPARELLAPSEPFDEDLHTETAQQQAVQLEKVFADFGYNVEVVDITTGPVVSQFELRLAKGLRLNKITALSNDLGIAMKVPTVRIVAPIPGKNTVGIELPNEHRQWVCLREVMESSPEASEKYNIPIYLGKDVAGRPMVIDLTKLPHLLIAGRTGTGKSVCLNSIIASILMTRNPEQVRMLMIDPKMVELSPYGTIPHLMHPVVTDMRKAEAILAWAVEKMEERYQLLASAGVRQLTEYNCLSDQDRRRRMKLLDIPNEEWETVPKSLPYIVIVADEIADMMMTAAKDVETHIIRLAQKSRAVGIHLILATQKPTVNVVTGLIKSNLPARIAFSVATRTDSLVVLDQTGAERLLGNGDMLFLDPETSLAIRGQGTYIGGSDIEAIVEKIGTDHPDFVEELVAIDPDAEEKETAVTPFGKNNGGDDKVQRDELYYQAVEAVILEGRGSLSFLQRKLGIGYGRAARMIDFMAEDGIVGENNGAKPREVLMTLSEWKRKRNGQPSPLAVPNYGAVSVRNEVPIRSPSRPAVLVSPNRQPIQIQASELYEEDDDDYYDPEEA